MYHEEIREIDIVTGKSTELQTDLRVSYGKLKIISKPETGADVYINQEKVGTTPFEKDYLMSGSYKVKVEKELWLGQEINVKIQDGQTTEQSVILTKNYSEVTVKADDSFIYVNRQYKKKSLFQEKLIPGMYEFIAKKDNHYDDTLKVFINPGKDLAYELNPKPRTGVLCVYTEPQETSGASIFIDNQLNEKKSPAVIPLLMGNHTIKVTSPGYMDRVQQISLNEGETKKITFTFKTQLDEDFKSKKYWKTNKTISFWSGFLTMAGAGASAYLADQSNKKYLKANNPVSAEKFYDETYQYDQITFICSGISAVSYVWSVVSYINQSRYDKKLRLNK